MALYHQLASLESTCDERVRIHLTEIERQIARAEGKLLKVARSRSAWTRPTLRLTLEEATE